LVLRAKVLVLVLEVKVLVMVLKAKVLVLVFVLRKKGLDNKTGD
jgi:hypothetical protein